MSRIPGEYLSPARYWLPRPETHWRMTHKHGRMRSWYWTPVQAEIVRDQA